MSDLGQTNRDLDEVPNPDDPSGGEVSQEVMKAFSENATYIEKVDMLVEAVALLGDDDLGKALHDSFIIRRNSAANLRSLRSDGTLATADEIGREEYEKALLDDGTRAHESIKQGSNPGAAGVPADGKGEVVEPTVQGLSVGSQYDQPGSSTDEALNQSTEGEGEGSSESAGGPTGEEGGNYSGQ